MYLYALLGLAADDPNTPALKPEYNLPWHQVLKNTIRYILSGEGIVETYPEKDIAIIQTKCWILGCIDSVEDIYESNRQRLNILFNDSPESSVFQNEWGPEWMIQASAELIQGSDILCLLRGNLNPSIIRLSKDHFTIVNIAITPQQFVYNDNLDAESFREMDPRQSPPYDITLTWAIPVSDTENNVRPRDPMELIQIAPHYQKQSPETQKGSTDLRVIVDGIALQLVKAGGTGPMENLVAQMGTAVPVSEQVAKAAVRNTTLSGLKIVEVLLQYQDNLPVTEEVVKAAAENTSFCGLKIMRLLFEYRHSLPIPEEVVNTVAMSERPYAHHMMELLFKYQDNIPVTEEVVKAVARNKGISGPIMMRVLFKYRHSLPVTEEVVKAVAGNKGAFAKDIRRINEEMVTAMEQTELLDRYDIVMGMLFKHQEMIRKPGWKERFQSTARKFRQEGLSILSTKHHRK
ncbi:hypothetical protein BDV39DRAFT_212615 [Aspergillus sergii]|uniref:Uncharacterized protein n=1 Tax=Aspergillus sergii TaxID=1034303 RepID=A0A5N6WLN2_9EURO|nr:hypothetical protein BDV39DRAFT_212615 [Aspergillus sergii]